MSDVRVAGPRVLRACLAQIGYDETRTIDEQVGRVARIVEAQRDTDLVVLPEMWLHGAFASHTWRENAIDIDGPQLARIADAARAARTNVLAGTFVERAASGAPLGRQGRGLWNTSVLFDREGDLIATYRKIHRFGFGDGEPTVIEAGDRVVTADLAGIDGHRLCTIGLATCYDLRFPELFRVLADRGSEVFVIPAAWPLPRVAHWQALGVARAIENQAFVVQVNDGGGHSGMAMGGRSQVVDPLGSVMFAADLGDVTFEVDLDLDRVHDVRESFPVWRDRRLAISGDFLIGA